MDYSKQLNDKIDELQQKYFTCDIDSLKSSQIEYELDYFYHLRNSLMNYETEF